MSLGYEVYEDNRSFEKTGLTGTVTKYARDTMTFPCYVLCATKEKPVEAYKISVLQSMFKASKSFDENSSGSISLYYSQEDKDKLLRLGQILPKQVKPFLQLFEGSHIDGFFDKATMLSGDYLYVLAE